MKGLKKKQKNINCGRNFALEMLHVLDRVENTWWTEREDPRESKRTLRRVPCDCRLVSPRDSELRPWWASPLLGRALFSRPRYGLATPGPPPHPRYDDCFSPPSTICRDSRTYTRIRGRSLDLSLPGEHPLRAHLSQLLCILRNTNAAHKIPSYILHFQHYHFNFQRDKAN